MSDNTFGPFDVRPGVLERSTNLVDLITRHRQDTTGLRLWRALSLEEAYGTLVGSGLAGAGGNIVMTARAGQTVLSPLVTQKGRYVDECRRGSTSFLYDPNEPIAGLVASDDVFLYFRLQEERGGSWLAVTKPINTGYPIRGPILVVPPAKFKFAKALSLQSLAPMGTGASAGALPALDVTIQIPVPMHVLLPRPASAFHLRNESLVGDALLVSYGLGMPMVKVEAGDTLRPTTGGFVPVVNEFVIAADSTAANPVPFSIEATVLF